MATPLPLLCNSPLLLFSPFFLPLFLPPSPSSRTSPPIPLTHQPSCPLRSRSHPALTRLFPLSSLPFSFSFPLHSPPPPFHCSPQRTACCCCRCLPPVFVPLMSADLRGGGHCTAAASPSAPRPPLSARACAWINAYSTPFLCIFTNNQSPPPTARVCTFVCLLCALAAVRSLLF